MAKTRPSALIGKGLFERRTGYEIGDVMSLQDVRRHETLLNWMIPIPHFGPRERANVIVGIPHPPTAANRSRPADSQQDHRPPLPPAARTPIPQQEQSSRPPPPVTQSCPASCRRARKARWRAASRFPAVAAASSGIARPWLDRARSRDATERRDRWRPRTRQ